MEASLSLGDLSITDVFSSLGYIQRIRQDHQLSLAYDGVYEFYILASKGLR